jgi:hypothetical protein
MMSGKGQKKAAPAQIPPQLMPLLNAFTQAGQMGMGQLGGALPGIFQGGMQNMQQQAATGFLPDFTKQIEGYMRPQMERSFDQGAASLREQAALTGGLSGSGLQFQMGQMRGQLESGLMEQMANIFGGALPAAISARAGATEQMFGLPMQMLQLGGAAFGAPFQNQQYRTTPWGAMGQGLMGIAPSLANSQLWKKS